jgi:hypothetical protein
MTRQETRTYLLVGDGVGGLAHELLDVLDAAHLGVDLLEHARALLQAKHNVLLDLRKLDAAHQLLELLELRVRLGQLRLLVLLVPQGQQRALLVALGQHLARHLRLALRQGANLFLVPV